MDVNKFIEENTTVAEITSKDAFDDIETSVLDPDASGNPVVSGTVVQWALDDFGNKIQQVIPIYKTKKLALKRLKENVALDSSTGAFWKSTKPSDEEVLAFIQAETEKEAIAAAEAEAARVAADALLNKDLPGEPIGELP